MATNPYFDNATQTALPKGQLARAENVDAKFNEITTGLDKLPTDTELNRGTRNYDAAAGGSATAYTATLSHVTGSYADGQEVAFIVPATNTGTVTLDVSGIGATEIVYLDGTSLVAGELTNNGTAYVKYNSTLSKWVLMATARASAAASSASDASDSADAAAASASSASTSASTATTQAGLASDSADAAAASASSASTSASTATTQAGLASDSADAAAASEAAAATSYDNFDDRFLGAKTSDPALDNDGDALTTGALYFNSTSSVMRVYNGSAWQNAAESATNTAIVDAGGYYTATDVEAALQEIWLASVPKWGWVDGGGGWATFGTRPLGWTAVRNSIGYYTITHNLGLGGSTDIGVIVSLLEYFGSTSEFAVKVTNLGSDTFEVKTYDEAGSLADSDFMFMFTSNANP